MAERIFVHVGTPKSGTSYLHGVLWRNADRLREDGFCLPGRMVAHYAAARSVTAREPTDRGTDAGSDGGTDAGTDAGTDGGADARTDTLPARQGESGDDTAWSRLARQVNKAEGAGFVGHPQLAAASADQARAAIDLLDGELHVVITARALHLQPALSWQDQVKSGLATTLDTFLAGLRDDRTRGRRFWRVHDVAAVAERWRADRIPAERVHIVPVRPLEALKGPGPVELWQRYAHALGLDPTAYDSDLEVSTLPLGPTELELLRRVHARRDSRFTDPQRHLWTRQLLAHEILGQRPATMLAIPDDLSEWLHERSAAILDEIAAAEYTVHGNLDVLASSGGSDARLVRDVSGDDVDEVASWTILRLQEELVHREPSSAPPPVAPEDGVDGILDLLEHIRAADTGVSPRPAPERDDSRVGRIRRALPTRRRGQAL